MPPKDLEFKWYHKIADTELLNSSRQGPIEHEIRTRMGLVLRKTEEFKVKQALEWKPQRKMGKNQKQRGAEQLTTK